MMFLLWPLQASQGQSKGEERKTPGPKGKKSYGSIDTSIKYWPHIRQHVLGTSSWITAIWAILCLSPVLSVSQGNWVDRLLHFSGCLPCLVGFWLFELMGGKRWRLGDRIKEKQGISPLCFWEHHCQCVLHGDTSAAILTCQALPHTRVPIALPTLHVLSTQE